MMLTGARSKRASRSDNWARAATSISSASRVTTSPKVHISSSLKLPAIIRSVVCHNARARLSGDPRETAPSRSRINDFFSWFSFFFTDLNCKLIRAALDRNQTADKRSSGWDDTVHAQVFGKYGCEVLSVKIRSNAGGFG